MSKPLPYCTTYYAVLDHELDRVDTRRRAVLHTEYGPAASGETFAAIYFGMADEIDALITALGEINPENFAAVRVARIAELSAIHAALAVAVPAPEGDLAGVLEDLQYSTATLVNLAVPTNRAAIDAVVAPILVQFERLENCAIGAVRYRAKKSDLFGVCFSGGGIRSATFSLGILQALGKLKLLRRVDYLSTVSGGGYIGGWLAGWIRRETDGLATPANPPAVAATADFGREAIVNVEKQLDPERMTQSHAHRRSDNSPDTYRRHFAEDAEPGPLHHLRAHSRYLAPATGLLSLDRWVLFAIYLRNLFINALIAVPLLAFIVLAVRLIVRGYASTTIPNEICGTAAFLVFFAMLGWGRFRVDGWLAGVRRGDENPPGLGGRRATFIALVVAALIGTWLLAPIHPPSGGPSAITEVSRSRMPDFMRPSAGSDHSATGVLGSMNAILAPFHLHVPGLSYFRTALFLSALAALSILVGLRREARERCPDTMNSPEVRFAMVAVWLLLGIGLMALLALSLWNAIWWGLAGVVLFSAAAQIGTSAAASVGFLIPTGKWLTAKTLNVRAVTTFAYGTAFGLLVTLIANEFLYMGTSRPALFATLAPPLFLLAFWLAGFLEVALGGGWLTDYEREWRSRFGAWMLLIAVSWAGIFATVIYLPQFLDNHGGTASVSVIAVLSGAVRYLIPRLTKSPGLLTWFAVRVVPIFFLVALLGLVASGVDLIVAKFDPPVPANPTSALPPDERGRFAALGGVVGGVGQSARIPSDVIAQPDTAVAFRILPPPATDWDYAERLERSGWLAIGVGFGIAFGLFSLFITVIPVNRFSLHALYANRLIRCYLGASKRVPSYDSYFAIPTAAVSARRADSFSTFDPDDDLPLVRLRAGDMTTGAGDRHRTVDDDSRPYCGPYPLFNTTLNMVSGTDLAFQDRRGESFVLTPDYCGSESTGYALLNGIDAPAATAPRLTDATGPYWNLTVGRAITISGAAVDANMTNYYSPQFTAFLTLMNARLGWWMRNPQYPGRAENWDANAPAGSWPYLREMAGSTDAEQSDVHLSDGGHYENTGAYELIRRRCRFVLLIDAAENPDNTSENLANLVRVVQSDFGIRIQIDTSPLKRGADNLSTWHCAVGAIRYDDVDAGGVIGTLVFVRSSLTGDEPADIKNYASVVPEFPHHPTADQFFDEAQFESYRGLGYHIGMSVLAEAADGVGHHGDHRFNRLLFAKLRRRWTPSTTTQSEKYIESCRDFLRQSDGADDRAFQRRMTGVLASAFRNTALPTNFLAETATEVDREQLQRAQLMEMAWLQNDLDRSYSHPIQRGWVNTMRGWTSETAFQRMWPKMRTVFSQGFVRFCERALNVNRPSVQLFPLDAALATADEEWTAMKEEFGQEFLMFFKHEAAPGNPWWPGVPAAYLDAVQAASGANIWLIGYGDPNEPDRIAPTIDRLKQKIGVVAVFPPIYSDPRPAGCLGLDELLLWVRGPYRMAGIGGVAMNLLNLPQKLFARFPRIGSGSAENLQRALWVQFMNDFDFYGVSSSSSVSYEWERHELRVRCG